MSTLTCRGVTVRYGAVRAVDGVDLDVPAGRCVALLGPNGAGKSSLLGAIVGTTRASGTISVDGTELPRDPRARAQLVASVPQSPLMPADMSGLDYVLLGRTPYLGYFGSPAEHDRQIALEAMSRLALDGFAERLIGEMSGGEQQRLVMARAAAQRAPILLLDEPTSALDIGHRQSAMELVAEMQRVDGLAVLMAMHDLTLAGLYADELVLLHRGRIVTRGRAVDVLTTEVLSEYYGANLRVLTDDDGTIVVVPRR